MTLFLSPCRFQASSFFSSRSEVSSSSSLDSPVRSAQQVSVQVLLHSHGLQTSEQDCEVLSSQEDLFEADKAGKRWFGLSNGHTSRSSS